MENQKLIYPTFDVYLYDDDGEASQKLVVRAAPFKDITQVKDIQAELLDAFMTADGCLSELIASDVVYKQMQELAGLLRVRGQDKPGLDIQPLYDEGDIVQLGRIFFSESVNADMRSSYATRKRPDGLEEPVFNPPEYQLNPLPSAISRIHQLPFFKMLQTARTNLLDKEEKAIALVAAETENQKLKVAVTQ